LELPKPTAEDGIGTQACRVRCRPSDSYATRRCRTTNTIGIDLSLYDTIAARNTALGSYTTTANLATTYVASNILTNVLTPYDTIS
jgi:hypothetical protein